MDNGRILECIGLSSLQEQELLTCKLLSKKYRLRFSERPEPKPGHLLFVVSAEKVVHFLEAFQDVIGSIYFLISGSAHHTSSGFAAGCSDFLRTPWEPEELLCRLERCLPAEQSSGFPKTFRLSENSIGWDGRKVPLSYQEYLVFNMLVCNIGRPVSREALYFTLWGEEGGCSRAVDMHISSLRKKLRSLTGISGIALLHTVHRKGYKADFTYWMRKCGKPVDNPLNTP